MKVDSDTEFVPFQLRSRSLISFGSMIAECTEWSPASLIDYGNWCGKGGGGEAVDEADKLGFTG